ncbi:MAG TPA: ABC transporter ATP-binding protein [Casimicrobiaceae bacterium]|nr:ABC transporter ATP-binding protein [Casimicrobiaceae bacterium]
MSPSLDVEGLCAGYDRADVLIDVGITARAGEITCILGSNGSGKTTLVRSILGLTPPRRGRIVFGGVDIAGMPTHRVIALGIACIPEGRRVFPKLTIEENLRVGAYREANEATIRTRLRDVYRIFPRLEERVTQLAGTMSGGEQAMLSIGRGLMAAPRMLLVDEPSLGLSPRFVTQNFDVIRRINAQGVTVLLVEQNAHQTLAIADRGYVLSKGRVVAEGSAAELRGNEEVRRAYFG